MPHINAGKTKPEYDVIVIGSGAAGRPNGLHPGHGRSQSPDAGGRARLRSSHRNAHVQHASASSMRDAGTPEKPFGFYDATSDGGWKVPHEPYTNASDKAEEQFWWWRARMLGGRTIIGAAYPCVTGPTTLKARAAMESGGTGLLNTTMSLPTTTKWSP